MKLLQYALLILGLPLTQAVGFSSSDRGGLIVQLASGRISYIPADEEEDFEAELEATPSPAPAAVMAAEESDAATVPGPFTGVVGVSGNPDEC
jgi:hypothetical protein